MSEGERKRLEEQLYVLGVCLLFGGIVVCVLWGFLPSVLTGLFHVPCVFHRITGLYCPGCGGTRAVEMLLQREVILSFFYHPIVLYGAVLYGWFMISHTIEYLSKGRLKIGMKYRNLYLYLALFLVIINIAVKDVALTAFHIDILKLLDNSHALV